MYTRFLSPLSLNLIQKLGELPSPSQPGQQHATGCNPSMQEPIASEYKRSSQTLRRKLTRLISLAFQLEATSCHMVPTVCLCVRAFNQTCCGPLFERTFHCHTQINGTILLPAASHLGETNQLPIFDAWTRMPHRTAAAFLGPRRPGVAAFPHLNVQQGRLSPPSSIEFDRLNFGEIYMLKIKHNYLSGLKI